MADFKPSRKSITDFNGGEKIVKDDLIHEDFFNNVVESQLFTQGLATNRPDTSEADSVGTPSVEITTAPDGSAQLKFINIRGKTGEAGENITKIASGEATSSGNTTTTPVTITTNKNSYNFNVLARNGQDSHPITKIESGTPIFKETTTVTPVTVTTENASFTFDVVSENGKKGDPMYAHLLSLSGASIDRINFYANTILFSDDGAKITTFSQLSALLYKILGRDARRYTQATGYAGTATGANITGIGTTSDDIAFELNGQSNLEIRTAVIEDVVVPISQKGEQGNKGDKGDDGKNATPITDIINGAPYVLGDKTITPMKITTMDHSFLFNIAVTNGKDGANGKDGTNGTNGTNGATITSVTVTKVS